MLNRSTCLSARKPRQQPDKTWWLGGFAIVALVAAGGGWQDFEVWPGKLSGVAVQVASAWQ